MATECNHNCQRKCPCPEACELPISFAGDEPMPTAFVLIGWIAAGMLALVAVSFIAGYFS